VKTVKKYISRFLVRLGKRFGGEEKIPEVSLLKPERQEIEGTPFIIKPEQATILQNQESKKETKPDLIVESPAQVQITPPIKVEKTKKKPADKSRNKIIREPTEFVKDPRDIRDVMELMEIPFVSLSKNRTEPINYKSYDGSVKVKISCHPPHYVASIYDWDIILFVSSKLQEFINANKDIPPRTLIIPRHELLKSIYKHDGKTNRKEMEESLSRLQLTGIETTIHNEDYRYRGGFGFLDSWGYTERKDIKEFRITLSEWLYEITCRKGSLLKVHPEYFKITSGLKRFLYRTARKHVGTQNKSWTFSIESLYEKSGSEQEFRKFKYKLKKSVKANDIPGYFVEWIEKDGKTLIRFINTRKEIGKMISR
jgi:plasmid replication initiation protein